MKNPSFLISKNNNSTKISSTNPYSILISRNTQRVMEWKISLFNLGNLQWCSLFNPVRTSRLLTPWRCLKTWLHKRKKSTKESQPTQKTFSVAFSISSKPNNKTPIKEKPLSSQESMRRFSIMKINPNRESSTNFSPLMDNISLKNNISKTSFHS